jgi:hypothetical protein
LHVRTIGSLSAPRPEVWEGTLAGAFAVLLHRAESQVQNGEKSVFVAEWLFSLSLELRAETPHYDKILRDATPCLFTLLRDRNCWVTNFINKMTALIRGLPVPA